MTQGLLGYKRILEEALARANTHAITGPIFGLGNRRFYEGCSVAYGFALEEFERRFESFDESDPAVLRAQIVAMRQDMERSLRYAQEAARDAVGLRECLADALHAAPPRAAMPEGEGETP